MVEHGREGSLFEKFHAGSDVGFGEHEDRTDIQHNTAAERESYELNEDEGSNLVDVRLRDERIRFEDADLQNKQLLPHRGPDSTSRRFHVSHGEKVKVGGDEDHHDDIAQRNRKYSLFRPMSKSQAGPSRLELLSADANFLPYCGEIRLSSVYND